MALRKNSVYLVPKIERMDECLCPHLIWAMQIEFESLLIHVLLIFRGYTLSPRPSFLIVAHGFDLNVTLSLLTGARGFYVGVRKSYLP
jgi:hypothetical protein